MTRARLAPLAILAALGLWLGATYAITKRVGPPASVGLAGPERFVAGARFLADDSWLDARGGRRLEQTIFDAAFAAIDGARHLVHVDMFLFNDFQGPEPERHRALSAELVARLTAAARRPDGPTVTLVTDPINTLYGGRLSPELEALRAAGVHVTVTDLAPLQDSNPLWSSLWRWLVRPFGNAPGDTVPNPLGPGRATVRSWLALANFKANHRKLLVVDAPRRDPDGGSAEEIGSVPGDALVEGLAIVTSANPHDGSAAHRNVALEVRGPVVADLLGAERALLEASASPAALGAFDAAAARAGIEPTALSVLNDSGAERARADEPGEGAAGGGAPSVSLANESAIARAARGAIDAASPGDAVDLEMFYLADLALVDALERAAGRGARVRALLDVNSDAFGRAKNGVPNRPVAASLAAAGVEVRWCATAGEQCHAKWLHVRAGDGADARHVALVGSGNFTRRNLRDLNLETNLVYRAGPRDPVVGAMLARFDALWANRPGRTYSLPYAAKADESAALAWQYRFMEITGLGTF